MLRHNLVYFAVTALASANCLMGQSSFGNLDFESPRLPLNPVFGQVPASNAIPGWTAYLDVYGAISVVGYNVFALDSAAVILNDSPPDYPTIQGSYSVYLQSASPFAPATWPTTAAIGQTGAIPPGAQSLFFAANFGVPTVTFAGQPLFVTPVGPYSGATLYGANISMFAGQSGELLFSVMRESNGFRQQVLLDAISFSSSPVPEPSAVSLICLGLLGLVWHWRRGGL